MLTGGELFAGIGGFSLAMQRAGVEVVWQVEIDERCQEVLAGQFPHAQRFGDVRGVGADNLPRVDLIAGGFPCQPVSDAGKRKGKDDLRWLWPEFARVVRELRPRYVLVENVAALLRRGFDEVHGDLAALGYDTEWDCLPASAFGAPHDRDRLFLVAYAAGVEHEVNPFADGWQAAAVVPVAHAEGKRRSLRPTKAERPWRFAGSGEALEDADGRPVEPRRRRWRVTETGEILGWGAWTAEPGVGRMADGVPARLDRLEECGNAVVPQIAEYVIRQIQAEDLAA